MEAPRSQLLCCLQGSKGLTIQYANNTLKGNSGVAGTARSSPARLPTHLSSPHTCADPSPGVRGVRRGHGSGRVLTADASCGLQAGRRRRSLNVPLPGPNGTDQWVWGRWPRTPGLYVRRAAAPAGLSDRPSTHTHN